jgi:hypothetical protein
MIKPQDTYREGTPTERDPQGHPESDPLHHTARIKQMLQGTVDHAREDVQKVEDPKARALFETTAEVLDGLLKAYDHYERRSEPAWR